MKVFLKWCMALALLVGGIVVCLNAYSESHSRYRAIKTLNQWYRRAPVSFYCGCAYVWTASVKAPQVKPGCSAPKRNSLRGRRIEWEHVVPASEIARAFSCEKTADGNSCDDNPAYLAALYDPVNLVPAVGSVNARRSNRAFTYLPDVMPSPDWCGFKFSRDGLQAEPPAAKKGMVARLYLYMHRRHGVTLSAKAQGVFCRWARQYPANREERTRFQFLGGEGTLTPGLCSKL